MKQDSLTCLVTGGAGFIGSNLVDALIDSGHKVVVVDDLSTGNKKNINKKAKLFEVDITHKNKLEEVFEKVKPDTVFHLAAQASVQKSIENPQRDIEVNVTGTVNLLELSNQFEVKNFIFSSTGGAIYGEDVPRPTPETADEHPLTPYGMDKLSAEGYIEFYSKKSSYRTVCLRYANVFGPRQDPMGEAGVISIFIDKMLKNDPIEIYGDGTQTRDFVYVGDVVDANLAALQSESWETYNIGSGRETSINQLAEYIKNITKSDSTINHVPPRVEQKHSSLDSSKASLELDWKSVVSLQDGLERTVSYFKKN